MQIQISIDAICLEVLPQHFQTACLPLSNKYWQSSTRTINGINRPLPQTTSLLSINYNPKYQGTAILALHKTFQGRGPADRDRVNCECFASIFLEGDNTSRNFALVT